MFRTLEEHAERFHGQEHKPASAPCSVQRFGDWIRAGYRGSVIRNHKLGVNNILAGQYRRRSAQLGMFAWHRHETNFKQEV